MIEIKLSAEDVKTILQRLKPINDTFILRVKDSETCLISRNGHITVKQSLPGYVDHRDTAVSLPLDMLEFVASRIKKGAVTISSRDGESYSVRPLNKSLTYTGEKVSEEMYELASDKNGPSDIGVAQSFSIFARNAFPSISTKKQHGYESFHGLHMNENRMEATNGVILSLVPYETPEILKGTLIHSSFVKWAIEHFSDDVHVIKYLENGIPTYSFTPRHKEGWIDNVEAFFEPMRSQFPDVNVVLPKEGERAQFPKAPFLNAVKDAQYLAKKQKDVYVDLVFEEDLLTVTYKSDTNEKAPVFEEKIPARFSGSPLSIRFNSGFLVTILEKQWMNDAAGDIQFFGKADGSCEFSNGNGKPVHIVMPMRR